MTMCPEGIQMEHCSGTHWQNRQTPSDKIWTLALVTSLYLCTFTVIYVFLSGWLAVLWWLSLTALLVILMYTHCPFRLFNPALNSIKEFLCYKYHRDIHGVYHWSKQTNFMVTTSLWPPIQARGSKGMDAVPTKVSLEFGRLSSPLNDSHNHNCTSKHSSSKYLHKNIQLYCCQNNKHDWSNK